MDDDEIQCNIGLEYVKQPIRLSAKILLKKGINQVSRHLLRLSLFHPKLVRQLKPVANLCISLSNSFLSSAYNIMPYEA